MDIKKYFLIFLLTYGTLVRILAQGILTAPPVKADASARYMFYFHGGFLENNPIDAVHPENGRFEYDKIKEAFHEKGFIVISELPPKGTDAREYAAKVAGQIKELIAKGVAPNHITAIGGSKGSYIAQHLSTILQNRYVNYVILAACNEADSNKPVIKLSGNVLSVYEASDPQGQSCQYLQDSAAALGEFKEIRLELGIKHKIVYQPFPEWMNPAVEWANRFSGQALKVPDTELLPSQLTKLVNKDKVYLVDVRTPEEYKGGHLQNSKLIDFKAADFEANIKKLDKSKPVYLYCRSGNRSGKAKALLAQWGFKEVHNIGAYQDLAALGVPLPIGQ